MSANGKSKEMRVDCRRSAGVLCGGDGNGRRRASVDAGHAAHLDVAATVAVVALGLPVLLVLLVTALGRHRRRRLLSGLGRGLGGRRPPGDLPDDAGEALEPEAALAPLATGFAGSIQGTEAGVDGALVCLGAEFVCGGGARSGVDGTVLARKRMSVGLGAAA